MDIEGGGYFTPPMFRTLEDTHKCGTFGSDVWPSNSKVAFVDQDFISLGKKKIWKIYFLSFAPSFICSFLLSLS